MTLTLDNSAATRDSQTPFAPLFPPGYRASGAIVPFQDLLNLGSAARMNIPGCAEGNWQWRLTDEMLSSATFARLSLLTGQSHRLPDRRPNVDTIPGVL